MRTKPGEAKNRFLWLLVNQQKIGFDMAFSETKPITDQTMISIVRWQWQVLHQQIKRARK